MLVYEVMYENDDSDDEILVVWNDYVCVGVYKILNNGEVLKLNY